MEIVFEKIKQTRKILIDVVLLQSIDSVKFTGFYICTKKIKKIQEEKRTEHIIIIQILIYSKDLVRICTRVCVRNLCSLLFQEAYFKHMI